MAHCWGQRGEGQVLEEEETQAPPQGNLSQRLYNDPSCLGRGFSPAQPACRTTSFARSRELYWKRHVGWNCSHCWDPRLWERQPHSPRSDGSGSLSVSPLLSSHSQGFMAEEESLITSHAAADAQTGGLQVSGRCGAARQRSGRAVSGAPEKPARRERESWARLSVRHPDPATS